MVYGSSNFSTNYTIGYRIEISIEIDIETGSDSIIGVDDEGCIKVGIGY